MEGPHWTAAAGMAPSPAATNGHRYARLALLRSTCWLPAASVHVFQACSGECRAVCYAMCGCSHCITPGDQGVLLLQPVIKVLLYAGRPCPTACGYVAITPRHLSCTQPTNKYFVELMNNDDWTVVVNETTSKPQVYAACLAKHTHACCMFFLCAVNTQVQCS